MTTTVELGVEIGFILDDPVAGVLDNTTYTLGGLAFIDMTDYVYSVSVTRGKNRELDRFNAGTCSVTLNNQNRIFDPFNFESPFAGNIVPRRRVRVSTDGVTQFVGAIDDWNFDYSVDGVSTASISGSDDFSLLARQVLSGALLPEEASGARVGRVLDMASVGWPASARVLDAGKSILAAETPTGNALDYLQTVNDSEVGLLFVGKNGSMYFVDRSNTPTTPTTRTLIGVNLNKYLTTSANSANVVYSGSDVSGFYASTAFPSGQTLTISSNFSDPFPTRTITTKNITGITAGHSYSFSCYLRASRYADPNYWLSIRWLDSLGSLVSTTTGSSTYINNQTVIASLSATAPANAVSAEFVVNFQFYTYTTWATGTFDFSSLSVFDTTTYPALSGYFDGNTVPSLATDYYEWDSTPGASVTNKYYLTASSSAVVFSDGGDIPFTGAAINYGTEMLINEASVSSTAGTATASNQTSQIEYGVTSTDISTLVSTSAQLSDIANFVVARYANPEYRFESVSVNLDSLSTAFRAQVLALEIGDVASISFTPNSVGDPVTEVATVIGISHEIKADRHDITFSFEKLPFTFFVLNDFVYGKLDYVGVLGF